MSPEHEGASLARQWREARTALLELVERIPESREHSKMERAGWTLKHELAHLASLDDEVTHLLRAAREDVTEHLSPALLRRWRGEAMHRAKEMRLPALREHLAGAGETTAHAIEEAAEALGAGARLAEADVRTVAALVRERLERAHEGVEMLRRQFDR